ncbi:serine/threonine protein phosphatase PrpC [Ilumatobacter fluminis]|uniref:Serine/threonine protein phosphatase PrpC n=1 Tax=Ilumatobacter fluminis TaxID=467091 RepID=A0A4R7I6F1_9ACTN|nr:Stp1/IreP family PP2C-type Ser/Thr phosphatase [Ilumatobacter fluminis]TDT18343.1 serine/threonine protein phosphatase PrpC [Ilumatobacter fluminis]
MAELRWGAATHEGQLRSQNEDHHYVGENLFVVADGMGGHLAGEVASEMAVDRLRDNLPGDADNTLDQLVAAIDEANDEIYDGSMHNPDQAGMGTTVTAVAVVADPHDGEAFGIANVGDSRGYVMRHARLRQLTIDHSFVQELVAEGAISREEARYHPRRNIVTRALGIEPGVRVDSWTMPIFQGDRILLCSDGLVDEITDDHITEVLLEHPDPNEAAQALVDAANEAGGRDNITVVIIDVVEGDDPPDPTEEFDVVPLWADDDGDDTGEVQIVADPLPDDEHDDANDDDGDGDEHDDTTGVIAATAAVAAVTADESTDAATGTDVDAAGDTVEVDEPQLPPADDGAPAVVPTPPPVATPKRKRSRTQGFFRFLLILGVAAVLVLGFVIMAAWARSGYFVAFDEQDRVVVYQGREDGFLWFEPTPEAYGQYTRDELDDESIALVEDNVHFESRDNAKAFVAQRLSPRSELDDSSEGGEPATSSADSSGTSSATSSPGDG